MRLAAASVFMIVAYLSGCATLNTSPTEISRYKPNLLGSERDAWSHMIGKWYGSQPTKEGGRKMEIMERAANGTFMLRFKIWGKEGNVYESTEVGQWGISGDIYFSIYRGWLDGKRIVRSDSHDPMNYNAYRIIELTEEKFHYRHAPSGNEFVLKKVASDFQFPK